MNSHVLITGATGFIGHKLCEQLLARGYQITALSRQSDVDVRARCGRVTPVGSLDQLRQGPGFDAVINLAGEGIAEKRWSKARKQALRDSRIALTEELVTILRSCRKLPQVLVSGSAVGYYGAQGDRRVDEHTEPHDEFSHRLCRDWEQAAAALADDGVRVCYSRTGVVAGPDGGFLERLLPIFRLGLGGPVGSGEQYMPWVHRDDVVNALIWMLETSTARGPYNVVSPNPVRNRELTRTLGKVLGRPAVLPAPALAMKLAFGEMSRLLLTGQRAVPERLLAEGFEFRRPDLEEALADSVRR